ncbi:RNA polymerase II C-terminal domain phosphatase-like 5 [Cucumispora dikerogammari]|nr:RNA polymerase II C-terminal domain phosphatase-like 5 [Cucumispora dikerogammari]
MSHNPTTCAHSTTYSGLCIECGQTTKSNTPKHSIDLTQKKRLNLVLDLDQTLIHSIFNERTNLVLDIQSIPPPLTPLNTSTYNMSELGIPITKTSSNKINETINENNESNNRFFTYEIGQHEFKTEMRPYLIEFLYELKPLYNFYVYTNGTRSYALQVVQLIKQYYLKNALDTSYNTSTTTHSITDENSPNNNNYSKEKHEIQIKAIMYREEYSLNFQKTLRKLNLYNKDTVILDDRLDVWNYNDSVLPIRPFREIDINEVGGVKREFSERGDNKNLEEEDELKKIVNVLKDIHEKYFNQDLYCLSQIKESGSLEKRHIIDSRPTGTKNVSETSVFVEPTKSSEINAFTEVPNDIDVEKSNGIFSEEELNEIKYSLKNIFVDCDNCTVTDNIKIQNTTEVTNSTEATITTETVDITEPNNKIEIKTEKSMKALLVDTSKILNKGTGDTALGMYKIKNKNESSSKSENISDLALDLTTNIAAAKNLDIVTINTTSKQTNTTNERVVSNNSIQGNAIAEGEISTIIKNRPCTVPDILKSLKNIFSGYIIDAHQAFHKEIAFLGGTIFNNKTHKSADIGIEKANDVSVTRKWLFDCLYDLEFKNTKYYRYTSENKKKRLRLYLGEY